MYATSSAVTERLLDDLNASLAAADERRVGLLVVHFENFDRLASALGFRDAARLIGEYEARLCDSLRPSDTVVRLSDARVAVVIRPLPNPGLMTLASSKLMRVLAQPFAIGGKDIAPRTRIGMAIAPDHGQDAATLLRAAEAALLWSIDNGVSTTMFDERHADSAAVTLHLESELDAAIRGRDLELYYQPKIATATQLAYGAEALLRWQHPQRGPVSPETIVKVAEATGKTAALFDLVMHTALRHAAAFVPFGAGSIAINATANVIEDPELPLRVDGALGLWDTPPERLVIEVTESAIMSDFETSFDVLHRLRKLGVEIAIDDFGTGYSSLSHFKNIPATELKIDKSFVRNMFADAGDQQIIRSIIDLSKSFGLKVTAEGVEDARTAAELTRLGCDQLQGFHYSRPLPRAEFIDWLVRASR